MDVVGSLPLLLVLVLTLWVGVDALRRCGPIGVVWLLGTLALALFVAPVYFAVRPLRAGETRLGGRAWNVVRNYALMWTVMIALVALQTARAPVGEGESATLTLFMLGLLWVVPLLGALLLGAFLRTPGAVEHGPTGRFAEVSTARFQQAQHA